MGLRRHESASSFSKSSCGPPLSPCDNRDQPAGVETVIGCGGTSDDPRSPARGERSPQTVTHRTTASRCDVRRSARTWGSEQAGYSVGGSIEARQHPLLVALILLRGKTLRPSRPIPRSPQAKRNRRGCGLHVQGTTISPLGTYSTKVSAS